MTASTRPSILPAMFELVVAVVGTLRASFRSRTGLIAENLALRQQLAVLGRERRRPKLRPFDTAMKRWAWLLAHVFRADLDTCSRCGGPMRWLEAATSR